MNLRKTNLLNNIMSNLKSFIIPEVATPKETIYLSNENTPFEKNLVYSRGTASTVEYGKKTIGLYFEPQSQVGIVNIREIRPETIYGMHPQTIYGMPQASFGIGTLFQPKNLAAYYLSLNRPKPILSDEILIVPLRELSYENAKEEITNYIQHAGGRKVYISELAEELRLDIELIMEIMEELKTETRD